MLTKPSFHGIITRSKPNNNGGIAQWLEHPVHTRQVIGSNPISATRPVGQAVKTRPFHGCNMGSIPVRVTTPEKSTLQKSAFFIFGRGDPYAESHPAANAAWVRRRDEGTVAARERPARSDSLPEGQIPVGSQKNLVLLLLVLKDSF